MKKIVSLLLIVVFSLLIIGCGGDVTSTTPDISTTVPITTTAPTPDYSLIENSQEQWLKVGLDSYLNNKEVKTDPTTFFADIMNLSYLTLYNDFYILERDIFEDVSALFFEYVITNYGYDALFDLDKRVEYKDAYIKSLGIETGYPNNKDSELHMSGMVCSSNAAYELIMELNGAVYYFKDVSALGSYSNLHATIYYNSLALDSLREFVSQNGVEEYIKIPLRYHYIMSFKAGETVSYTESNNLMHINATSSMLHESAHASGIRSNGVNNLWLSEGLCEYFGKIQGYDTMVTLGYYRMLTYANMGAYDAAAAGGDVSAIRAKNACIKYRESAAIPISIDDFDLRLFFDSLAYAELSLEYTTVSDTYARVNGREYTGEGAELTYAQCGSFVTYLIDRYSIDSVLRVCNDYSALESAFGKSYDELYADWINYIS